MQPSPELRLRGTTLIIGLLATACILIGVPAKAGVGFKLYKAKESNGSFPSNGNSVKVWQFAPKEGDGPFPGIVLLYGLDCIDELPKTEMLYKNVAGTLADNGFVVHMVHYFNCTPLSDQECKELKQSLLDEVPRLREKALEPRLQKPYVAWMEGAKAGVAFLRQQKNVDPSRVGIVGLSMGGFIGSSLVVEHPELKVAALVNVFGGLPPQQFAKIRSEKMKLPPMLIMGAEDDDIVPESFQRDLFLLLRETGNRGEAHFYGDVGHAFLRDKKNNTIDLALAMNEALPVTVRFVKRHVQGTNADKK